MTYKAVNDQALNAMPYFTIFVMQGAMGILKLSLPALLYIFKAIKNYIEYLY
jgi:hypothetical protein